VHPPTHAPHPEKRIPDSPFSQAAAPSPPKAPAEELTEFPLVSQPGRYVTGTVSAGSEDAARMQQPPLASHPARTRLPTAPAPRQVSEGKVGFGVLVRSKANNIKESPKGAGCLLRGIAAMKGRGAMV